MEEALLSSEILKSLRVFPFEDEYNKLEINNTSFGSSIIRMGDTVVMCLIEGALSRKNLGKITYVTTRKEKEQYIGNQL